MTTTTATELSIAGALATLATLAPSHDVATAIDIVTTAPTDASGTARVWFENHRGQHVDTVQFRTWCGHDTLAVWAPLDRVIDTPKASYATLNGSAMTYKGTTVLGASTTALVTIDRADGFLTFYRVTAARPTTADEPTTDAAANEPTDDRPTLAIVSDGRPFNVRRVDIGQHYGLSDRLTNDTAPMVEVFDASPHLARFGPLGQFVSRYYVDTFAAIIDGVDLCGGVAAWTLSGDAVREVQAWLATFDADETTDAAPATIPTDPANLNAVMSFDHVVRVLPGRIVVDGPTGIYAPNLNDHAIDDDRWSPVGNYTSQEGGGWLMHNCESIGGRMAVDILDEPGVYVAVVAYWSPDETDADDDGPTVEGWAVVRLRDEFDPMRADDAAACEGFGELIAMGAADDDENERCATEGCANGLDDGEGQEGYCGDCADRLCCDLCADIPRDPTKLVTVDNPDDSGIAKVCARCHVAEADADVNPANAETPRHGVYALARFLDELANLALTDGVRVPMSAGWPDRWMIDADHRGVTVEHDFLLWWYSLGTWVHPIAVAQSIAAELTDDGDTFDLDDGRQLRLSIRPDDMSVFDHVNDADAWGRLEWSTGESRPDGFDGRARVLEHDRGSRLWWQPCAGTLAKNDDDMARDMRRLLADGFFGVIVTLHDADGAEVADASLWGIDSGADGYLATVVADLVGEVLADAPDATERDDIDVDTLDELRSAAATLADVVRILTADDEWSADTLDAIAGALIEADYARTDDDGMFATTNRADRVR